jgi:hypothetical protein
LRQDETDPTQGAWDPQDPRRDRDPGEPVDYPKRDEPMDDPDNPIPDDPIDEPVDSPSVGEPPRRDPDPKEPERRLRGKALSLEPGTFRRARFVQGGGCSVQKSAGKGLSPAQLPGPWKVKGFSLRF